MLLVLAGATLAMISGNNGILKKVVQAKESTEKASVEERIRLAIQSALSGDYNEHGKITKETLIQELENNELIESENDLEEIGNKWILATNDERYIIYSDGKFEEQQSQLPAGYKELAYIESTGTQYIDTGIACDQNSQIECTFSANEGTAVMGAQQNAVGITLNFKSDCNSRWGNDKLFGYVDNLDGTRHTMLYNKTGLYDNGVSIFTPTQNEFTTNNIWICRVNGAITATPNIVYGAKIWNNNILVGDFIPCKDSSNVVGMFNTVLGIFFENKGMGDFIAGPEIE